MTAPRYTPGRIRSPELRSGPGARRLGPAGWECKGCRLVLLATPKLAEVTREELEALLGDGQDLGESEAYRHGFVRERYAHARLWARAQQAGAR